MFKIISAKKRVLFLIAISVVLSSVIFVRFLAKRMPVWAKTITIGNPLDAGNNTITASQYFDPTSSPTYYVDPAGATSAILAGKVGVGVTSPNGELDVASPNVGDGIVFGQANTDNNFAIQAYIDGQYANRTTYASACCNTIALQPDVGGVIIGGTSGNLGATKLYVNGITYLVGATSIWGNLNITSGNINTQASYVKMGNGYAVGTRQGTNYRLEGGSNAGCTPTTYYALGNAGWYCNTGNITFAVAFAALPSVSTTISSTTAAFSGAIMVWNKSTTLFAAQASSWWGPATIPDPFDWLAYGPTTATNFDLAESYKTKDQTISSGDVVCVDPNNNSHIIKCQNPSDATAIGIVSTNPGMVIGDDLASTSRLVGLQGRAPVKVTLENGPIKRGDPLTPSATKPGYAMKAIKAGPIIGKALQPFDGSSTILGENAFDGLTQPQIDAIIKKTKETGEGQTMAFINISWYDPDFLINSTGDLTLTGDSIDTYTVKTPSGITTKIGAFADVVAARIKTGLIETKKLFLNGIDVAAKLVEMSSRIDSQDNRINSQDQTIRDLQTQIQQLKANR